MKKIFFALLFLTVAWTATAQEDKFFSSIPVVGSALDSLYLLTTQDGVWKKFDIATLKIVTNLRVRNSPILYTPTLSGNTNNLNEIVTDPNGNIWIIDYTGNAVMIDEVIDGSETNITGGTNVSISGSGTALDPFVISAYGGDKTASEVNITDLGENYTGTTVEDALSEIADSILQHSIDISSGYKRSDGRIDVRDLGITPNTNYSNAELAVLIPNDNVKLYFPQDTFIFRNWQIQDKDRVDILFDNTTIMLPASSTVDVYNEVGTTNFDIPQIAIVNCKEIKIDGEDAIFDHSDETITWEKPASIPNYAGAIHITTGTDFADYGDIDINGITFKESYYLGIRVESPSAWIHYDSTSYNDVTFTDIHCDLGTGLLQTRVTARNILLDNSSMVVDIEKGLIGASDLEKALGFSLDVNSEVKTNLHVRGFYSKYGGAGFYQNIQSVQLENVISDSWGYFPLSASSDGDIVTATWKTNNPGLWDANTMLEFNGGSSVKIDNYYYKPDRVFIVENYETRNTNQFEGTNSISFQVESGNENFIMADSYIDEDIKFSNPMVGDGLARKAIFNNCVFSENSNLWVSWGTTFNNCFFRDTVSLASDGIQHLIDTTSTWKAGVLATTTGNAERVRFNDCTFTNRGITSVAGRVEVNNCQFEGYSEINYGGSLTARNELIVKNSYGGRYRQSLAGTSDSLEIRFINHDRLGMNSTTFNNLQSSPYCEVRNSLIINYDSTEVADLQTSIEATLTEKSRTPDLIQSKGLKLDSDKGAWQITFNSTAGSSVSSGAYVIETDIPFDNATYFLMEISFYRYYVTATRQIGKINVGSYLSSSPDFFNEQAISTGEWGGTDKIRFAANADNEVVIIIGETTDSYGSYACHFIFNNLLSTNSNYIPDISTWTVKSDTDVSEYTVKQTVTGTQIKTDQNGDLYLNAAKTVGVITGTGSPESSVTASVGALYIRTDGGTSTTLYVKESGSGNTGWVAK
jgi:hypothetical protein